MKALWLPFLIALGLPVIAWLALGARLLLFLRPPSEDVVQKATATVFSVSTLAFLVGAVQLLLSGQPLPDLPLGALVALPRYHIALGLHIDGLSLGLLGLTFTLVGLVAAFSVRYLHREPGFSRFFFLLMMLTVGLELIAAGEGLDLLFAGWELVGLSSALLIAFFHRRQQPLDHGLRAYATYRAVDVALLLAVVLTHHLVGSVSVHQIDAWAGGPGALSTLIGVLVVIGAMGKSGSVPFSGWVPRAMEGPTPSSAIFYGALSIHLGPYLLLRMWPILEASPGARVLMGVVGLLTALHGSMVGRAQHDIKGTLAYASLAQVGLMFIEVSLGFTELATLHLFGHAVLRANQLLRAPSVLSERDELLDALGAPRPARGQHIERLFPAPLRRAMFKLALERWYLDDLLDRGVVGPVVRGLKALNRLDQRASAALSGPPTDDEAAAQLPAPLGVPPLLAESAPRVAAGARS